MQWYVVHVLTGAERDVRRKLARAGLEGRVPSERRQVRRKGRWQEEDRILMPGYVFIGLERFRAEHYHQIKHIPGVIRLLGDPTPIGDREAAFWNLPAPPRPLEASTLVFDRHGKPTVVSGPLLGREANIAWINQRQRRAGVRVRTPDGEKIVKFSIIVPNLPGAGPAANKETVTKPGSIHSPAAVMAGIAARPGSV